MDLRCLSLWSSSGWVLKNSFPLLPSEVESYKTNPLLLVPSCSRNASPEEVKFIHPVCCRKAPKQIHLPVQGMLL